MKPRIFVTRRLPQAAMDKLESYFEVTCNPHDRVLNKQEIIEGISDRDALLCLLTDSIDDEVLGSNGKLQVVSNYAVGFNNIDLEAANRRGIPVCITPGVLTETTADLTFGLILSVARRLYESEKYTREGKFEGWAPELFLGGDVYGKTLGIVGMGRIGLAVARRALGFGMKVIYTKRSGVDPECEKLGFERVDLETALSQSDFLSLHVPLTPESTHLIDAASMKKMKPTSYLINTARGPVVDEAALVQALKQGEIAGAGLDVFEEEPKIHPGLMDCPNAVILPHIGSATLETRSKMGILAAENAIAVHSGEPPHAIANPQVLATKTGSGV